MFAPCAHMAVSAEHPRPVGVRALAAAARRAAGVDDTDELGDAMWEFGAWRTCLSALPIG